jgi:hypothetical protein
MTDDSVPIDLTGDWLQPGNQPGCAAAYPRSLSFRPGTYRGTRGEGQGFVRWDAGIYRVQDGGLELSTATDELVRYAIQLDGDLLTVVDPEGCRITYQRVPPPG